MNPSFSPRPAPQHQRVDEQADDASEALVRPSGHQGADEDVVLAGDLGQQDVVRRQQQHVHRHPVRRPERAQRRRQSRAGAHEHPVAVERPGSPARKVGRQVEDRPVVGQQAEPEALLAPGFRRPGEAALPAGEVLVPAGRAGQASPRVEPSQLVGQDVDRDAVADDVVEVEEQDVVVLADPDQAGAHQRRTAEVERPDEALADRRELRRIPRPAPGEGDPGPARDPLDDLVVDEGERGPQGAVARGERGQGAPEAPDVEPAAQPQRHRDVVLGAPGRQAVEDVHPRLVRGGGRLRPVSGRAHRPPPSRRRRRPAAPAPPRSARRTPSAPTP